MTTRSDDVKWLDEEIIRLSTELNDAAGSFKFREMEVLCDRIASLKRLREAAS